MAGDWGHHNRLGGQREGQRAITTARKGSSRDGARDGEVQTPQLKVRGSEAHTCSITPVKDLGVLLKMWDGV